MADIFDELNSDFRAERMRRTARRLAIPAVALVVLAGAGAAGLYAWRANQAQHLAAAAASYLDAARGAGGQAAADDAPTPARAAALAGFDQLAVAAPEGYRTLSRLRAAGLRAAAGDVPGAVAGWDAVANDGDADPLLRDLARLLAAQRQADAGEPAVAQARLQPLLLPGNPWRPLAREVQAVLALRAGRTDEAKEMMRALSLDPDSPNGLRARANAVLMQLGEPAPQPAEARG